MTGRTFYSYQELADANRASEHVENEEGLQLESTEPPRGNVLRELSKFRDELDMLISRKKEGFESAPDYAGYKSKLENYVPELHAHVLAGMENAEDFNDTARKTEIKELSQTVGQKCVEVGISDGVHLLMD
jgi:hypothetical protein